MKTPTIIPFAAALLAALTSLAQQTQPSPQSQAQNQPAPCVAATSPSGNNAGIKVPDKWKQLINKQRQQIQSTTGIPMPDVSGDIEQAANSKPTPCPPRAIPTKTPLPIQPAALKLPPDTTVTLHCNPMTPSPKDATGHPTTLTLADSHDFAVPRANEFEADSVVPDLAARTPCYAVKVDPKTSKSFVAQ